ncbi:hypothetical protein EPN18_07535 [bacterium]|nr:MAG: hypothetical protein EPN18_07535 [bacterium]
MIKKYIFAAASIIIINLIFFYAFTLSEKTKADAALFNAAALAKARSGSAGTPSILKFEKDLSEFYAMLSKKKETAGLMREIDYAAKAAALSIQDISYASEKSDVSDISKISFSFSADGEYSGIKNFMHRLESSKSFFVIEDAALEKTSANEKMKLKLKVSAYVKNE